ncbi:hypothetical protein [Rhizobium tumorigenes]|uniref:Uncharacterized protein n=1 Tax=Rhizobium tumorigenes TaxID=2041385 RepID=A0AAF1K7X1_9HYPH|nr:hypothetical protein [Rhizobium tumorigenes]WFR97460.1 hypothetical protein PR017_06570 [Rhizobium tumorigenes]WFS03053.1 hypothetical protein PR016_06870 [Rhizobium tumorigenes]
MNTVTRRKKAMPDKVILINVVWMTVITGMLAFTVALYGQKADQSPVYGPYASAHSYVASQY